MGFLFGSKGSDKQTQIQKTELPPEIQAYSNRILKRAEDLSFQPYQAYPGQRVHPLTGDELRGMGLVSQSVGQTPRLIAEAFQPAAAARQSANVSGFIRDAAGFGAQAATPWYQSATAPAIQNAFRDAAQYAVAGARPWQQTESAAPIQAALGEAGTWARRGAQGWTTGAADAANIASLLANSEVLAGRSGLGWNEIDRSQYMNPYAKSVTDIAARELENTYARQSMADRARAVEAGAFGSDREGVLMGESRRALGQNLGDIYLRGGDQAYRAALEAYNADRAARAGAGASLASLAGQRLGAYESEAGRQLATSGTFANQAGQLLSAAQQNAANRLAASDAMSKQAGQYLGAQQQDQAGRIAAANAMLGAGNLQLGQAQAYGTEANRIADLARAYQSANLADAAAMQQIGATQRGVGQSFLDAGSAEWERARRYPYEQVQFAMGALGGTPYSQTTTQQSGTRPGVSSGIGEIASLGLTGFGLGRIFGLF